MEALSQRAMFARVDNSPSRKDHAACPEDARKVPNRVNLADKVT